MSFLLLIAACLFPWSTNPADEVVTATSGAVEGELVRLDDRELEWRDSNGVLTYALADLERINFSSDRETPTANDGEVHKILLIDGSTLYGDNVVMAAGELQFELAGQSIAIQRRNVDGIHLASEDELAPADAAAFAEHWQELREDEITEDILTLRKVELDDTGNEDVSFSNFEGVIDSITELNVDFQFGGDAVPVKRERIQSLRFYHPTGRELPEASCRVELRNGSRLLVRSLEGDSSTLRMITTSGVEVDVPTDSIASVDFAFGRISYLDDLTPTSIAWSPFIRSNASGDLLEQLNGMRRNQAFDGGPLTIYDFDNVSADRLGAQHIHEFSRGLALRSESRLTYSTAGNYTRFLAVAGIDPVVRPRGNVDLIVRGDGEVLFKSRLTGNDREPAVIDIDITNVSRLSIEVEFADQLDIGDQVNLCRARFVK